eukprot:gene19146-13825_t
MPQLLPAEILKDMFGDVSVNFPVVVLNAIATLEGNTVF